MGVLEKFVVFSNFFSRVLSTYHVHVMIFFLFHYQGKYSSLRAKFVFKRRMGFYMIQVYLPSLIITILSWLSFYIDPRDIGERVSLGR